MDVERLRELLGKPELKWLVDKIRARLARGGEAGGKLSCAAPSLDEREALRRLLGQKVGGDRRVSVDLDYLADLLQRGGIADSLLEAVEALTGPVVVRGEARRREAAWWDGLFEEAASRDSRAEVRLWLDEIKALGLLRRLAEDNAQARALLDSAIAVVGRLPARDLQLKELAAMETGSAHGLDDDQPLTTLVFRFAARLAGAASWGDAASRRGVWRAVGVQGDELSAPVLVLGLRGCGSGLTDRALNLHADGGMPYRLSLHQLREEPPLFEGGGVVYVCENVAVVQAATKRLGVRCRPLICMDGQPGTAGKLLLDLLARAGWCLNYHGDFDWPGIRIGNLIMSRHNAGSWRMHASDYRAAPNGIPLQGEPVQADWDEALREAMCERGQAIHEELVMESLLNDLAIE